MRYLFLKIYSPFLSILITSLSVGTVKVMYLSLFFPEQENCNSSANAFTIKLQSYLDPLWNAIGLFLVTLYFKLLMLCAGPLYSYV